MTASIFRRWFGHQPPSRVQEALQGRAESGDAEAQFDLGFQFASGKGSPLDYAQAARWYLKAAEQSHAGAQFNLGTMYAQGQGVPADKARSIMWIDRAARLGNAAAQHALGIVYLRASLERKAENPSESRIEAYKWLQLAAMQGCRNSDTAASALTFQMTHKDVADGNRRVATFVGAASDAGPGAVISTAGEAHPMTSDSSAHTL